MKHNLLFSYVIFVVVALESCHCFKLEEDENYIVRSFNQNPHEDDQVSDNIENTWHHQRDQDSRQTRSAYGLRDENDKDSSKHGSVNSSAASVVNKSAHTQHHYHVAVFDFQYVATPFIVSVWVVFASAAKIVFHMNNRLSSIFPESCLLIFVGVTLGVVLYFSGQNGYELDSKTFFLILLPPIILEAGYFMPNRAFFDNIGTILLFAVVGTLLNALCIGLSLWGAHASRLIILNVPLVFLHVMVFASLLAAVDPVAVLAVFEEVHVNEILHIVVFGESLLNDGNMWYST